MSASFLKRYWPALSAGVVLSLQIANSLRSVILSRDPVPAGFEGIWKALEGLAFSTIACGVTIGFVLLALVRVEDRASALEENVGQVSRLLKGKLEIFDSTAKVLEKMESAIGGARQVIYLMYFRDAPASDPETLQYWKVVARLFAKKRGVKIRRIASVDRVEKLEFLLRNNQRLIKAAGSSLPDTDYRLLAFPHTKLVPPQIDVIDDRAFLFSPYSEDGVGETLYFQDDASVSRYKRYFSRLMETLGSEYTLFSTLGRKGKAYSLEEVGNIVRVCRDITGLPEAPDFLSELVKPYCDEKAWEQVSKNYSTLNRWKRQAWRN